MQEALSPVVQVVTSGTDWPAIVAGITTGVVGVAGIGGTLWQGKRARQAASKDLKVSLDAASVNLLTGINADMERGRLADKRKIYANYQAAVDQLNVTISAINALTRFEALQLKVSATDLLSMVSETKNAATALVNTLSEVMLIAPKEIGLQAQLVMVLSMDYVQLIANKKDTGEVAAKIREVRGQLYQAMRADLGEPVEGTERGSS